MRPRVDVTTSPPGSAPRHALVVMGAAGAGKSRIGSALAAALQLPFVEGDAFHPPGNIALMAAGTPLTDADRHGWLLALAAELRAARDESHGMVLACSALRRRYRDLLRAGDESVRFIFLSTDADVLRQRLAARSGHFMPVSMVDSQLEALEPPDATERAWTFDARALPDDIVRDVLHRLQRDGAA